MYTVRQYVFLYAAFLGSMVTGASVVHAVLQPDLSLPAVTPPAHDRTPAAAHTDGVPQAENDAAKLVSVSGGSRHPASANGAGSGAASSAPQLG